MAEQIGRLMDFIKWQNRWKADGFFINFEAKQMDVGWETGPRGEMFIK
jgi:hypothetical protein